MDPSEYKTIISSGEQSLDSAKQQSEHPSMERFGLLLKNIVGREGGAELERSLRAEQIQTRLLMEKLAPMVRPGTLLEIGCGFDPCILKDTKIVTQYYLDLFLNGLLESKRKLNKAEPTTESWMIQGDLNETLPFKNNSMDNLLMVNTSGAIKNYEAFAGEVWRILSPGGKFILCGDAEPNTLPSSSGAFYLNNELWVHEILEKLKEDYSAKIYVAGPAMPLRAGGEYRKCSRIGTPIPEDVLQTGEFVLQEATQRMLKFQSGKLVQNQNDYKELTETETKYGKKYFIAYMRMIVAEKKLASKGWDHLTEPERIYVKTQCELDADDENHLRQIQSMCEKGMQKDPQDLKDQLRLLQTEGEKMDLFSLKKNFPRVFASTKKKKVKNPLQACILFLEKELAKCSTPTPDKRLLQFNNRQEVQRTLAKKQFLKTQESNIADRLMEEMKL